MQYLCCSLKGELNTLYAAIVIKTKRPVLNYSDKWGSYLPSVETWPTRVETKFFKRPIVS